MAYRVINLGISSEQDMVAVRQRARQVSAVLGFGAQDQVRVATAVSELARTAFAYASGGDVEFSLDRLGTGASLLIHIKSSGGDLRENPAKPPGVIYSSDSVASALESALISARRLMDDCRVDDESGRARVITLRKAMPPSTIVTTATLARLADHIQASPEANTFTEVTLQNRELLETLAELRNKQEDLLALTQELEDTNRGVVALYAEIEEKAERLRQADVYKDEFLATLAHELRNPLAPIRNAVELMRRADPRNPNNAAAHAKAQQIISRQVDHLARLVDDLLDVARISQGKITLQRVPTDLHSFINTAVETIQPFIDHREHQLSISLPEESVRIMGDPVRLAQIVGNLLNNAAKYTSSGGRISLTARYAAADRLQISVRDNGIGLSQERIGTVFTLFAQGETAPDRAQDGLGIGLSLVSQLVALHDGTIRVESEGPGHGSTFVVELPTLATDTQHGSAASAAASAPVDGETDAGGALKILLVDDNTDSVTMTAMLLDSLGHLTFIAQDSDSAIAAARQHVPDLVLLDIGLPGADGYAVARSLRQQAELGAVTLVAVTGYGTTEDKKKAFEAGFDHHLVKPVKIDELLRIVNAASRSSVARTT